MFLKKIPRIFSYPYWYFISNGIFWFKFVTRSSIMLKDSLGLKAIIKNFFAPFRKDRTWVGRFMGVVVRTGYGFGGIVFLIIFTIILIVLAFMYFALPVAGVALLLATSTDPTGTLLLKGVGLAFLVLPLFYYVYSVIIKAPKFLPDGYPEMWEHKVAKRLMLSYEEINDVKARGEFEQYLKDRKLQLLDYEIVREWTSHRAWEADDWKFWQDEHFHRFIGTNLAWVSGFMRESKYFTEDLTSEVLRRKVYKWKGMDDLIERILTVMAREHHNNALLVGAPGVGKTSVIYSVARLMNEVGGLRVISLNAGAMMSGAGMQGEFERRFAVAMNEFGDAEIVLVIENVDQLVSGGVAHHFFPILEGGYFPIIASATHQKMREVIEPEGTFINAFEQIPIVEPELPDVFFILQEKIRDFERRYGVFITYQAMKASVELSEHYVVDRAFPTKAIDLLEEACSAKVSGKFRGEGNNYVTDDHIKDILTELTGIAVGDVEGEESEKLLHLEQILHERIIAQDDAVSEVAAALRRARSGLSSGERPIASFLFLGPTGVGKSLTTKSFAEVYFGSQDKMVRFDMSEFSEFGTVDRFLDRASDNIRSNPFTVVLLDEFEKADRKIHNLFLQVLEDGRITDTKGNVVNFTNTIIVATSNAVQPELAFSPELRNRFDGMIQFKALDLEQIKQVSELELKYLAKKMEDREVEFVFSPALIEAIAELGYDPQFGARPIRRAIQDHVENPLADALIKEDIEAGDKVLLDWENSKLKISHLDEAGNVIDTVEEVDHSGGGVASSYSFPS